MAVPAYMPASMSFPHSLTVPVLVFVLVPVAVVVCVAVLASKSVLRSVCMLHMHDSVAVYTSKFSLSDALSLFLSSPYACSLSPSHPFPRPHTRSPDFAALAQPPQMMLYTSPDPVGTLCDTALETDIALETSRSETRRSRRLSIDSMPEWQPLVRGEAARRSAYWNPVDALYRLQA